MISQTTKTFGLKKFKADIKNQQGITLLLAILLLSAILSISFSIASILFFQIRTSGDLAKTAGSIYAADGVAEQALFNVKRSVSCGNNCYSSTFNNTASLSSPPTSSSTSTPIFQDVVLPGTTFLNTKNKYDFCGASATSSGCGYGQIILNYLPTGNSDSLTAYLCEFSGNPNTSDLAGYAGAPCTDKSNDFYWITGNTSPNAAILIAGPGGTGTHDYGTLMSSGDSLAWPNLNPNKQQQLILYNTGSHPIYISIKTFGPGSPTQLTSNDILTNGSYYTPVGLPYSGKVSVQINTANGQTGRKIQVIIPNVGTNTNNTSAITGVCATPPNGSNFYSAPSGPYCSSGTPTALSGSGPWTWSCNGSAGNASCSAGLSVDGVCGTANGGGFASAPTTNLCSVTASTPTVSGSGPWTWSCTGSNGGSSPACSANKVIPPQTPCQTVCTAASTAASLAQVTQIGYKFTVNAPGQITKLGSMVSGSSNGSHNVTLYDYSTGAILATATVITPPNTWSYTSITPVNVVSGHSYVVSTAFAVGSDFYQYQTFPAGGNVTTGNITINYALYMYASQGSGMPNQTSPGYMLGYSDVTFVPN